MTAKGGTEVGAPQYSHEHSLFINSGHSSRRYADFLKILPLHGGDLMNSMKCPPTEARGVTMSRIQAWAINHTATGIEKRLLMAAEVE